MDTKTVITAENFLDNLLAYGINFNIELNKDEKNTWIALGKVSTKCSVDGEKFGTVEKEVKTFDKTTDGAVATILLSMGNFLNSPEFVDLLYKSLTDAG